MIWKHSSIHWVCVTLSKRTTAVHILCWNVYKCVHVNCICSIWQTLVRPVLYCNTLLSISFIKSHLCRKYTDNSTPIQILQQRSTIHAREGHRTDHSCPKIRYFKQIFIYCSLHPLPLPPPHPYNEWHSAWLWH